MTTAGARPRRWAVVAAAFALLACGAASAADDNEAAVAALPGIVDSVASAGRWQGADGAGFYRVVVLRGGYEHVVNQLYLQWLRDGDSESPPRVVRTVGIKELNEEGPYRFTREVRAERMNGLVVIVSAKHVYTGQRLRLTIRAGEPGVYRATPPAR